MEIGCHLPNQGPLATREAVVTFAREAERRDVASLWISDHVIFPRTATGSYPGGRFPHPPDKPYLEPVTVLTAAAVVTDRARLGSSVFILGHRHPVVMAKMLASIDALSGGRLICGVGVGWWKEELEILGVPFHARGRQADEAIRVFKALWTTDNPAFEGEFFKFRDIGFAPKPVQKPHPPIWVGGDSPGAFRRVVTLGDGWHATSKTPTQFREALGRLRAAADAAGRRFEDDRALTSLRPQRRDARSGTASRHRPARRIQGPRPEPRGARIPPRRSRAHDRDPRPRHRHDPPRRRPGVSVYGPGLARSRRIASKIWSATMRWPRVFTWQQVSM